MQTPSRRLLVAAVSVACILSTGGRMAAAQQGDAAARAAAERQFQEARALMQSGNFADACPKLEASLALYPALGVRLNLARCYERIQRPASAWQHYREVAERDGQTRRAEIARQAAEALEPHLPRLVVQPSTDDPLPGLVVTRDGVAMAPGSFGSLLYVDPGEHALRATAPGHRPFEVRVRVGMDEQVAVVVPPLQPEATPAGPAQAEPAAVPAPAGARAGDTGQDGENERPPVDQRPAVDEPPAMDERPSGAPLPVTRVPVRGPGTRRTVAWVAGGGGAVMLAAGLGFGLAARAAWDDARQIGLCDPEALMCEDPRGPGMVETARTRARVSSIAAGAGTALLVTGAVLYWMSRDTARDARAARIVPAAAPGGIGLAISGAF